MYKVIIVIIVFLFLWLTLFASIYLIFKNKKPKRDGVLEIRTDNDEIETFTVFIEIPIDDMKKKKRIILDTNVIKYREN